MRVCRKVLRIKQVDEFEGFDPILIEVGVLLSGLIDPIFQVIHLCNILRFFGPGEGFVGNRAIHSIIKQFVQPLAYPVVL